MKYEYEKKVLIKEEAFGVTGLSGKIIGIASGGKAVLGASYIIHLDEEIEDAEGNILKALPVPEIFLAAK